MTYLSLVNTVEEIKAAAEKLTPDQQYELFQWWVQTEAFRTRQLQALKADLALGLQQLQRGEATSYDEASLRALGDEICSSGRKRMTSGQ